MLDESKVYNKIAKKYFIDKKGFYPEENFNYFVNLIKKDSSILDLGCGPGQVSKMFSEKGYYVTCLDFSEEMLNIARREVPRAKFVLKDIRNIDNIFNEESFEGIWACASFLHFPKEEIPSILKKVYTVLKNKGFFYISVKEGEGEKNILDERYNLERHFSYFKESELKKLLEDSNFKTLKVSKSKSGYLSPTGNNWIHFIAEKSKQP
jgi:ubiquinone/menaquinone biosynthesis C-methylase UbiE